MPVKKPSNKLTREAVRQIKVMLASGLYHQHQIAAQYDVNQGRISEVKNGHYDHI